MVAAKIAIALIVGASAKNQGYKSSKKWLPRPTPPLTLTAELDVSLEYLPKSFDWRELNMVTSDWNQHIPQYCGSCWIHGTMSALNDRLKIARNGSSPDVMLGRQAVLNCVPDPDGHGKPPGCNGGDPWMIHKYLSENLVPDESCMPYQAKNMGCQADTICRNCKPDGEGCYPVKNFIGYGVAKHGTVSGERAMMKEIHRRGPIACGFATDDDFMFNYSSNALKNEGVYMTSKQFTEDDIDHIMEVTGWGETKSGIKYWVVRNSWGTYWGEGGWSKIARSTLMAESECDWAELKFEQLSDALASKTMGDYNKGVRPASEFKPHHHPQHHHHHGAQIVV